MYSTTAHVLRSRQELMRCAPPLAHVLRTL